MDNRETALEKFERIKRANKKLRASSGAQGPKTPPVQGPYQKATKGMLGSRGGPNKQNVPTPGTKARPASSNIRRTGNLPKPKLAVKKSGMGRNNLRTMGVAAMAAALNTGSLRNPVSKAKAAEAAKILAKKEKSKKPKKPTKPGQTAADKARQAKKQAATKKEIARRSKKKGFSARSFDNAFAAARKAGKKEFTWRGKRYNTKLA